MIVATDTLEVKTTKHIFSAKRKKEVLPITIIGDSVQRKIELPPQNSFAYYVNYIYPNVNLLFGYFIDRESDKRYAFPTKISVDLSDNQRDYYDYNVFKKAKQLIKFTPMKLVGFHNSSFEVAYERPTGEDFSTQIMASVLLPNTLTTSRERPRFMTRGFRVAIEERYYFKKDAPYGPYFALELDFLKKNFYTKQWFSNQKMNHHFYETPRVEYEDVFLVKTQFFSSNFKFGYQKEYEKFFVDFYFGLGKRYHNTVHEQRENPEDFFITTDNFPFLELKSQRIAKGKFTSVSVPVNVRLGWRF